MKSGALPFPRLLISRYAAANVLTSICSEVAFDFDNRHILIGIFNP